MDSAHDLTSGAARRRSLPKLSPVWGLNALLVVGFAVATAVVLPRIAPIAAPISVPLWALAIVFLVAEVWVVHLEVRKEAQSFSLAEVPLVVGLVFTGPLGLIVAEIVGMTLALGLHRRQKPVKLVFNVAQTAIATSITIVVFHLALGRADVVSIRGWAATLLAVLAASTFSNVMIFLAITLTQGTPGNLPTFLSTSTLASLANAVVGLTAVALMWLYPPAAILVVALVGILFLAYRAVSDARKQRDELGALYEASHLVLQSPDLDVLVRRLLENARTMFKCEVAEVMLLSSHDQGVRSRTSHGGAPVMFEPIALDPSEGVWARVTAEQRPVLVGSTGAGRIAEHFRSQGVNDGLVAPLVSDGEVFGTLLVANRESSVRGFGASDLELVETFANNVSVAIRNGRLIKELARRAAENEHLALHDPLTELPNRTYFHRVLHDALNGRGDDRFAVVLVDLDRFKEVNDTLGHHNGDLVLKELGRRLQAAVRPGTLVARLGGDEFGLVFSTSAESDAALARAREIVKDVSLPYALGDLVIDLRATMGVALCPEHGNDSATLLQRADVALYWAKDAHESAAIYSHDYDHYSPDRLALVGELRHAIELGQLTLHYQPKVSAVTEAVVGVEALVRWNHPRRGLIPAGEFVELAERTGLVRTLTTFVLEQAVRQARMWLDAGLELPVSVNLSARDLENPEICAEVGRLLERHNVPPHLLELEVTESAMIRDPEHADERLGELARLGISLSIDDFGTGYSSLSYLARLSVHTLKIDRSFVQAMGASSRDETIVRSMIELGRGLGLSVVAEGAESAEVIERLRGLGCDVIQGYGISRPLSPELLESWLQARTRRLPTTRPTSHDTAAA